MTEWFIAHKEILLKETWAAWALVIVAIWTARVAIKTLKAIRHEAKIAQESAEAARLNAQAVINSERAWLVATIEADNVKQNSYKIAILNQGRTPAKLIGGHSTHCFIDLPDNLPVPPAYNSPFVLPDRTFIVNRDSFPVLPPFAPEEIIDRSGKRELVKQARLFLMFYGHVVYEDVFSSTLPKPIHHETRWCWAYVPHGREFRSSGPNEYTGHHDQGS